MVLNLGDADFTRYCEANPDLRIERTAEGSVLVLEHSGWENSNRNAEIIAELHGWSKRDCRGKALDAGVLYMLPNGAARSAHASWVLRFAARNPDDRSEARLSPICPDFVVELRSPSDRLPPRRARFTSIVRVKRQSGWSIRAASRANLPSIVLCWKWQASGIRIFERADRQR